MHVGKSSSHVYRKFLKTLEVSSKVEACIVVTLQSDHVSEQNLKEKKVYAVKRNLKLDKFVISVITCKTVDQHMFSHTRTCTIMNVIRSRSIAYFKVVLLSCLQNSSESISPRPSCVCELIRPWKAHSRPQKPLSKPTP